MSLAEEHEKINIIYYGQPGSGKTTSAAYAAKLGETRFYSIEPGLKAAALRRLGDVPLDNIEPERIDDVAKMIEQGWWFRENLGLDETEAIVFDSMTELVKRAVDHQSADDRKKAVEKAEKQGKEYDGPRHFVSRDTYQEVTQDFRELIRLHIDLPAHTIYTAHVRRDVDEDDGEVVYGPAMSPAIQQDLVGYVDLLCKTTESVYEDGRPLYVGRFSNGGKYLTKDRYGLLPELLAYPTFDRVVGYVNGELTAEDDPLQREFYDHLHNKED